jgi:hypothetical protein
VGEPPLSGIIRAKHVVAEQLRLDFPGAKLAASLRGELPAGAALRFDHVPSARSVAVVVGKDDDPALLLTAVKPVRKTTLTVSPSGHSALRFGDQPASNGHPLPSGMQLQDTGSVTFIDGAGQARLWLDVEREKKNRSIVGLCDDGGRPRISLTVGVGDSAFLSLLGRNGALRGALAVSPALGPMLSFPDSEQRGRIELILDVKESANIRMNDPAQKDLRVLK